jgi:integrase
MASIYTEPNGNKVIQFTMRGKRPKLRLGDATMNDAREVMRRVELLLKAARLSVSIDSETVGWLSKLDPDFYDRLAELGLAPQRVNGRADVLLEAFAETYIAKRNDVKPATKEVWRQGKLGLVGFFGAGRPLTTVTAGEAEDYKQKLIGDKLAPYTISKRLQFAKKIFTSAVDHELIPKNPFAKVRITRTMEDRKRFITREATGKLLDTCPPGPNWRMIIVLARYGGLRCPSEVLSLTWESIDWERNQIRVISPKTAHHLGKDTRTIPLFPELRSELEAIWTPEATGCIVDEKYRQRAMGPHGWRNCNLRTTFEKIVKRAGLTPWPRLFHNLRSSRQTELEE